LATVEAYRVYLILEAVRGLGLGLIVTAPIYRIESAGFGPLELVLAGTALEIAYFASEVPTGVVADVYSRRLSCVIGSFVMGAGWLLEGSIPELWAIMLGQALLGMGWTFFSGAAEAWIAGEIGEARAPRALVRGEQIHLIAAIAGGFGSAALATRELNLPILAAAASHVGLGIVLIAAMPERGFVHGEHASRLVALTSTVRGGARAIRGNRFLIVILVSMFLMGAASEGLDRLWEAHLYTDFEFTNIFGIDQLYLFAIVAGVGTALSVLVLGVTRRFVERESDRALATISLVMTLMVAAGCMIFGSATSLWVAVGAYWVVRVGRNVLDPTLTVWTVRHTDPSVRATVLSMHGQSHSIGEVFAGPTVGTIGRVAAIPAALVTSGIIEALALPLLAREALRAPADAPAVPTDITTPVVPLAPGDEPIGTEL
jgi:DHA3 family tetracycline resistance protein-like MFS transporter